MDRKIVLLVSALIICVCLAVPGNALAYSSYDQGNMSTTYITYFDDIVDGLPYNFNYVATRCGQYEYILHASENLKYANGTFLSDNGTTYKITVGSGYNSQYKYDILFDQNFNLDTNGQMVYSDLGNYPRLDERGSLFEYAILCAALVCGLSVLIRSIFKYVYRSS